jgi:putative ABC transport system ATP-binding protein
LQLEVHHLHKSFHQGDQTIQVLKDLNLRLSDGEKVAILGKSGSGKSTLLALLAGLDDPQSGKILVGGKNLFELSEADRTAFRSKDLGIIFQQFHLVDSLTAVENVELPLLIQGEDFGEARKKALDLLEKVGLKDRASHFPRQLSGGECQRVAIARALIHKPQLILADEPSGNLDQETGKQVMSLLFELLNEFGVTALLVTHSLELAEACDRKLELKDGQLVPL